MIAGTLRRGLEYYVGRLPPEYQCEDHARIGQMLDQYGIPFFYRQPILICGNGRRTIQRPDFSLPTYNGAVLEYIPSDGPAPDAAGRSDIYKQNGITALFLQRFDLVAPHWQERLYDRLEQTYRQPLLHPAGDWSLGRD